MPRLVNPLDQPGTATMSGTSSNRATPQPQTMTQPRQLETEWKTRASILADVSAQEVD